MPIQGRSPEECFTQFEDHLRPLLTAMLGERRHVARIRAREDVLTLQLSEGAVPIETHFGRLFFYVAQELQAVQENKKDYRLETRRYWYRLLDQADPKAKALLRWEYDKATAVDHVCRHHLQTNAVVKAPAATLDLNKLHVPTGWVLIEELLRFLIVDLGVEPACGAEWPQLLTQGEKRFFEDFTSKRSN